MHGFTRKLYIPVRTPKRATPLEFCRGISRPVNWYRLIPRHVITCDKTYGEKHLSKWAVSSSLRLDFREFKRFDGSIYRSLRELSLDILYLNEHNFESPRLYGNINCGNSYISLAIFWLHLLISSSRDRSLGLYLVKYCLKSESTPKARSTRVRAWTGAHAPGLNQRTANYANTVYFIHQGKYSNRWHGVRKKYTFRKMLLRLYIIHLMYAPEGNS